MRLIDDLMQKVHLASVDARGVLDFECRRGELGGFILTGEMMWLLDTAIVVEGFVVEIFLEVGFNVNVEITCQVAERLDYLRC